MKCLFVHPQSLWWPSVSPGQHWQGAGDKLGMLSTFTTKKNTQPQHRKRFKKPNCSQKSLSTVWYQVLRMTQRLKVNPQTHIILEHHSNQRTTTLPQVPSEKRPLQVFLVILSALIIPLLQIREQLSMHKCTLLHNLRITSRIQFYLQAVTTCPDMFPRSSVSRFWSQSDLFSCHRIGRGDRSSSC